MIPVAHLMCCSFGFLFVFVLCLIWPMKPVSLDCPLFIIHSVFFNMLMLFVFLFTVQVPASCLPFRYLLLVYRSGTCFLFTVQVLASCLPSRYLLLVYHPGTCFLFTIQVPASCLPSMYLLLVYHPGTYFLFTIQVPALAKYVHIIVLTPRDLSVSYQNVSVNTYQQITALITN
jgi:hypothetical protein